eukprot:1412427-Pyramimonas_sp.AAC.1
MCIRDSPRSTLEAAGGVRNRAQLLAMARPWARELAEAQALRVEVVVDVWVRGAVAQVEEASSKWRRRPPG